MAAVFRKAPASGAAAVLASVAVVMALLVQATPAAALVPYGHGLMWDLLDDPFRVLEHSPFSASATPRVAGGGEAGLAGVALARCDWKETPDAHVISVDVPGVRREDVKVEVEENSRVLRVSGERRADEEKDGERWHRAERAAGRFWRRFRMPAGADVERVTARLENGVLTVTVPKVDGHRGREPRVISIAGGAEAAEVKASKAEM
ncbi:21.9 kDa heat shock protein [Dichanthelium oligosanthes]|uniref:21.9 kDa heat shock protein n=1 Tax=Dichanthelium oligosanthes TaxID=888268 RepID=A0A1E5V891_9POAL|nr:21.9 kDa heat shock protein [Dichanthelium oligosanthes]